MTSSVCEMESLTDLLLQTTREDVAPDAASFERVERLTRELKQQEREAKRLMPASKPAKQ
jgi:ASC-1-like (ASCH) protein